MNFSFDYYKQLEDADVYLCNPNMKQIGTITLTNRVITSRFNNLSDFTCNAYKYIKNTSGALIENPFYDKIETNRLLFIDGIGWFKITKAVVNDDGTTEYKSITAQSHETIFKNKGFVSEERIYKFYNPLDPFDEHYNASDLSAIPSVVGQLVQQLGIDVQLHSTEPEIIRDYGNWTLVYIEPKLWFKESNEENICRSFESKTTYGYDFMVTEVEKAFEVIFEFDYLYHSIKVKFAESVTKPTNIYLSYENLLNSIALTENSDDIVTVLSCNGSDLDIRTVNPMGTNYIVDFSYYKAIETDEDGNKIYPWMSKELIDALDEWQKTYEANKDNFSKLVIELQAEYLKKAELAAEIQEANLRLMDLQTALDQYREDIENNAEFPTDVETVKLNKKSLNPASKYYNTTFTGENTIQGYTEAPTLKVETLSTDDDYADNITVMQSGFDSKRTKFTISLSKKYAYDLSIRARVYYEGDNSIVLSAVVIPAGETYKTITVANIYKDIGGGAVGQMWQQYAINGSVEDVTITGTVADKKYTYEFSDGAEVKSGTFSEMIENYIPSNEDDAEHTEAYLYFQDEDASSYCKIAVATEVAVGKDASGDDGVSTTISKGESVYVNINSQTFRVYQSGSTEYQIYSGASKLTTLTSTGGQFNHSGSRYRFDISADNFVTITRYYVEGFDRFTAYAMISGVNGWYALWEGYIASLNAIDNEYQSNINNISDKMTAISELCNIQKFIKNKSDNLYDELQYYWIEGDYSNDYLSTTSLTTIAETIELAKELMEAGEKELAKVSQPTFTMEVDSINFINQLQFKEFTDQLILGRVITIEKNEDVLYYPALTSIEFNLDDADMFTLTFSNAFKTDDTMFTYADLISEAASTSRTVSANWGNLMDYSKNKETITKLIEEPLNRTLRLAQSNMANQEFTIDDTGILGRKYTDDSLSYFSGEQMRITNNVILFTDDYWETARLALGKVAIDENTSAYGLIADVLVGTMILGQQMKVVNDKNTITLDEDGIAIKNLNNELMFQAKSSGGVYVSGYATIDEQEELAGTLRQEFKAADGELLSTVSKTYVSNTALDDTLKDYSTTTEMSSAIQQKADEINLSVSKTYVSNTALDDTLKDYSTTTEMTAAIKVVADSLTAYAKKTEGNSTSAFGYTLSSDNFIVWNGDSSNPVLQCDANGVFVSGRICADDGEIGGLYISDYGLTAIGDSTTTLSITNGQVYATKLETEELTARNVTAENIYAPNKNAGFDFTVETGTQEIVEFTITKGRINESNKTLTYTVSTKNSKTVDKNTDIIVTFSWWGCKTNIFGAVTSESYWAEKVTATIPKDGTSYTITTTYGKQNGYADTSILSATISPDRVYQSTGAAYCIGVTGGLIPKTCDTGYVGTSDNYWASGYFNDFTYRSGGLNSDKKFKTNILPLDKVFCYQLIENLAPKSYILKDDKLMRTHYGFVAQEVETAINKLGLNSEDIELVRKTKHNQPDSDDNIYSLSYTSFIAPMVEVIQDLIRRIHQLELLVT